MKHLYTRLLFLTLFFGGAATAQQATSNPGVPGACGYPVNNSTARTSSTLSPQNGSGTLGNVYSLTKCGLKYLAVSNRLGQRFTPAGVGQPAPFVVSGLNPCDSIDKAFLWVEGSGNGAAQTATIQPPSGPAQNFPMTVVGTGPDKCWSYSGSYTYRADVTSAITGNGTYNISGILTNPPTAGNDMDGATLIVIYHDPTASYQGTMIIDDGAIVVNGGTASYNMNYPAVCGATQNAEAFICVGDIQMAINSLSMNGTPASFTWNWWNYVNTATTVSVGQTTSNFTLTSTGDCFNLCVAGLYYQTTTCAVCNPASSSISLTTASTPNTSCISCDGTATVTPVPAGSYTYSWAPSGGTGQTATGLCPGTYTVTVTGSCGSSTQTITVGNTSGLSATSTQNNVSCFGNTDGVAIVTPSGGVGPYTFNWTPVSGTNDTLTGLAAGSYSCTITDANSCSHVEVVTITQPPGFSVQATSTNVLCNGQSNGTAIAVASGGSPGYVYNWAPVSSSNDTIVGLPPGSYTVSVTDTNGCGGQQIVTITEPALLADSISIVPVTCINPGSATVTMSGGTSPYTYQWSSGGTGATEPNLSPGTYVVTVTDANGCSLSDTAVLNANSPVLATGSQTNITCFGGSNGTATVNPTSGQAPFTYSWSPTGGTNATATGLSSGTYTCLITDANGCTTTQSFTITEPTAVTATTSVTAVSCNGGTNGSATVTAGGGIGPYTYLWSPAGGTGQTATGLSAGSYSVTVTDASGCTTTQSATITQPTVLTVSTTPVTICAGESTTVQANGSGGTTPYTYLWSTGGQGAAETVTPSQTTTYSVTITDANGCSVAGTVAVQVAALPVAAFTSNAVNGMFAIAANSGPLCFTNTSTNAATWLWDLNGTDTSSQQSPCVQPTTVGPYCVTLVTMNTFGCIDTAETCIEITNVFYQIPNVFTPNGDATNDVFVITNTGMKSMHCRIYDRWGMLVYEWDGPTGSWDGKTLNGGEATDGVYYFTVYMTDVFDKVYDESGFVHLIRGK